MSFINTVKQSFLTSLKTGPRSNEKLKILHGFIARDLQTKLGDQYKVIGYGIHDGKEGSISGRYMDKNVDIIVMKNNLTMAGLGVKFVMSNYSQNSNNYFENMLGETANIRSAKIPYFQIFIIPERLPYYQKDGAFAKWDTVNANNLSKYIKLSEDNIDTFYHTPNKTLFALLTIDGFTTSNPQNSNEFINYYTTNDFNINYSKQQIKFNQQTVYNDYESFIEKVKHFIFSI